MVYHDVLVFLARVKLERPRVLLEEIFRCRPDLLVLLHPDDVVFGVFVFVEMRKTLHGNGALEEVSEVIVRELVAPFFAFLLSPFPLYVKVSLDDISFESLAACQHHGIFEQLAADHADEMGRDF